jgi:hypothetical protein
MINRQNLFISISLICFHAAIGYSVENQPHIGYLYPAGGRQGQEVLIIAGGQFLQQPQAVYISGKGVHAAIVQYYRPITNLQKEQREWIINRLKEARDNQLTNTSDQEKKSPAAIRAPIDPNEIRIIDKGKQNRLPENLKVPDHPLLYGLDGKNLRQLAHIQNIILRPRSKIQPNRQIAETILLKMVIEPDAEPGVRELRIKTATGLTNPMTLQVGTHAEYTELEPNDQEAYPGKVPQFPELPKEKSLELPVVLNGQILPGDIDRFRFHARAGQQIVIETQARSLIPYLADAVPGWFQAVIALYDDEGNEIAYEDDYLFNPDPVLFCKIDKTGDYELMIRDSIYRGREDFIYRVSVGELPFITQMFPLGGKQGEKVNASIEGWNLPVQQITLDTISADEPVRMAGIRQEQMVSNVVPYAVDNLPEVHEIESHGSIKTAQPVEIPIIINGRINRISETDVYEYEGKKGDELSAEVYARRLNSPLDSLLRFTDAAGKIIEWNDDSAIKDEEFLFKDTEGLLTHHADSRLTVTLPSDGKYYFHLSDSQNHGGAAYGYRLHLTQKSPDFGLRMTPSSLSGPSGAVIPFTLYVLSKNGFKGEIEVTLKDAPSGFQIHGGRIPAGKERIQMTLRIPSDFSNDFVSLRLEGRYKSDKQDIIRQVIPAEDVMQAFLYRHLVPSKELIVTSQKTRLNAPIIELSQNGPIDIPEGGASQVYLKSSSRQILRGLHLQLQNPPSGVSLQDVRIVPDGLAFSLKTDNTVPKGLADNLIIEAFKEFTPKDKEGKLADKAQLRSVGLIPAVPIRILTPSISTEKKL